MSEETTTPVDETVVPAPEATCTDEACPDVATEVVTDLAA